MKKLKDYQWPESKPMQIGEWLKSARQKLKGTAYEVGSETPDLDLQVLMADILQQPRSWVVAHPEVELTTSQVQRLSACFDQLSRGKPLPYITGYQHFMGLMLAVTPDVLIPRPETEELVEIALHWLKRQPEACHVVDVGTGSGCIAASIASQLPALSIVALDRSWPTIQVARRNFNNLKLDNQIQAVCGNLLDPFQVKFDLICANLPYIPSDTLKELEVYHKEPRSALDGGPDGLAAIRTLLKDAPRCLASNGLLLLETESSLGTETKDLANRAFPQAHVTLHKDLAGHPRIIRVENHAN